MVRHGALVATIAIAAGIGVFAQPAVTRSLRAADTDAATVEPAATHPAAAHIERLGTQAIEILTDPALSEVDRARQFQALLANSLDVPQLARFTLGRYWRRTPEATREAFTETFGAYMLTRYGDLLSNARQVTGFEIVRVADLDHGHVLVETRVLRETLEPIALGWRLSASDNGVQIIDVVIEGLSLAHAQRDEFRAVLRDAGGDVNRLITLLRSKTI